MHNEMLQVEGKKMSKSLGNFFTVRDLLDRDGPGKGVPGDVIRYVLLGTHYGKPMDWTKDRATEAFDTLLRWWRLVEFVEPADSVANAVLDALSDDLNTAGALAALADLERLGDLPGLKSSAMLVGLLSGDIPKWAKPSTADVSDVEAEMQATREIAVKDRDFAVLDTAKTLLVRAGDEVRMNKDSVEIMPNVGSDEIRTLIWQLIKKWRELSWHKSQKDDAGELREALKLLSVRKVLDHGQTQDWKHTNPDILSDSERGELLADLQQLAKRFL
jgi:cysteinyl-tRNA synthetase